MTSASGTITSCGPSQGFSLQFTCTGPSCSDLDGFPESTCTDDGTSLTCTNGVVCPGPTNYTSAFTFSQSKVIVSQAQHIALPEFCADITVTSDGTTGGTNTTLTSTGSCGFGNSTDTTNSNTTTILPVTNSAKASSNSSISTTSSESFLTLPPSISSKNSAPITTSTLGSDPASSIRSNYSSSSGLPPPISSNISAPVTTSTLEGGPISSIRSNYSSSLALPASNYTKASTSLRPSVSEVDSSPSIIPTYSGSSRSPAFNLPETTIPSTSSTPGSTSGSPNSPNYSSSSASASLIESTSIKDGRVPLPPQQTSYTGTAWLGGPSFAQDPPKSHWGKWSNSTVDAKTGTSESWDYSRSGWSGQPSATASIETDFSKSVSSIQDTNTHNWSFGYGPGVSSGGSAPGTWSSVAVTSVIEVERSPSISPEAINAVTTSTASSGPWTSLATGSTADAADVATTSSSAISGAASSNATAYSATGNVTAYPFRYTGVAPARPRAGLLTWCCTLLLACTFFLHGAEASMDPFVPELLPVSTLLPRSYFPSPVAADLSVLGSRKISPGWKSFADDLSEYLSGKVAKPEFASNIIAEVEKAICDHVTGAAAGRIVTKIVGADLVETCVEAISVANLLIAPEAEFAVILGAGILCNLLVAEALPGIGELTDKICEEKKPCSDSLLTDPNNCGTCGNVCRAGSSCKNGACTSDFCTGQTCSTYGPCGPGGTCVCASTTEGTGFCVDGSTPCAGLALCDDSTNCASGEICAVGSCCGRNVCVGATFCGGGNGTALTPRSLTSKAFGNGMSELLGREDGSMIASLGGW